MAVDQPGLNRLRVRDRAELSTLLRLQIDSVNLNA